MELLITTDQLNHLLFSNPDRQHVVVFDCRFSLADFELGRKQYNEAHIPGAIYLDMEADLAGPKVEHGGRHPLPSAKDFEALMRSAGVNQDTLVIAYDNQRFAGAARLWWLLNYFGHHQVSMLDGGFAAWQAEHPTSSQAINNPAIGDFVASPDTDLTVDYQWLVNNLSNPETQLIDSRETPRYEGLEEPIDPVAGHIPGAINHPWQGVTNEQGFALPPANQKLRWQGLDENRETIVYCGSGVTACVNLLSLKLAGIENTKLYPGSWSDWCTYRESPKSTLPG